MSYDIMRAAYGPSPWQVEDEVQKVKFSNLRSKFRQPVTSSIYTGDPGHCFDQLYTDKKYESFTAVNTVLNIDLILLKVFSHTDFQTLKNCRVVRNSWRNCADFEIRRRNCSRTFVTPQNVLQLLSDLQKTADLVTSIPSSELVLEKIECKDSSSYWSNLEQLFFALCPPESEHVSQVKGLTIIWPSRPKKRGPSKKVIHHFLQILQLVSSSLQELNVTHYLMAHQLKDDNNDLLPNLTFDLPNLRSIKILPRAASDVNYYLERLTLTSRSLGLKIIEVCPNLEKVDNFHLEDPLLWPKYVDLVKNFAFYQPHQLDDFDFDDRTVSWLNGVGKSTNFPLESLSDSFDLFPYQTKEQRSRWGAFQVLDTKVSWEIFINYLAMGMRLNTLKELRLGWNTPSNFSSPCFRSHPIRNLQYLQVKIGRGKNIQHYFNLQNNQVVDDLNKSSLPHLKTVSLVLESEWEDLIILDVNYTPKIAYRSVTSLELRPEFLNLDDLITFGPEISRFKCLDHWLGALNKFFPNIYHVTLTNFLQLEYFLPLFLGSRSKFNLWSISFNVHLKVFWKYQGLSSMLKELIAKPESRRKLGALRKMDVFFEDYPPFTETLSDPPFFSPKIFQLFLNRLPKLQVTFHYNQNPKQIPQELFDLLQRLAPDSPRVHFQHLSREPWTRSVEELLLWNKKPRVSIPEIRNPGLFSCCLPSWI